MISMILLMQHLVEATNEDGARPKVTRGPSITPIELPLQTGIPTHQVEDEQGRTHLLIHLTIEEQHEHRWCLWRPDHAGVDSRSIFESALIEEWTGISTEKTLKNPIRAHLRRCPL
jgi:hypothetical protein